jgi:hypothetical protein
MKGITSTIIPTKFSVMIYISNSSIVFLAKLRAKRGERNGPLKHPTKRNPSLYFWLSE